MTDHHTIDTWLKEIAELQHSDPEAAFVRNEAVLEAAQAMRYEAGYGLALNNKGNYYFWRDESDSALEWYIEADRILSQSTDWENRLIAKTNIAMVYSKIGEPARALEVYQETEAEMQNQPVSIKHAQVYLNIDVVLLALGRYDEARSYATRAYEIAKQLGHPFGISLSANHIAGCCIELGDAITARQYIDECFAIDQREGFQQQLCMDYFRAAVIANMQQQYNDCISYSRDGLALLDQTPNAEICNGILAALAKAYEATGQYEAALRVQKTLMEEKLAYASVDKAKAIVSMNRKYNVEKKEAQLQEIRLQKLDAELKAIKSQMNPHFAFNTLKTIDYQLESGHIAEARQSLASFAQLMRTTLEMSSSEHTTVADEVLLLENYIRLEQTALGDSFRYSIEVDPAIDPGYERVPSIFVQPIVENAIKHGLRHSTGARELRITFGMDGDSMMVTVADNGIGRAASAAINRFRTGHSSYAGDAMQRRVSFLNEKAGYEKYMLQIADLPQGTCVTLRSRPEAS